jgi:hypothetical protein
MVVIFFIFLFTPDARILYLADFKIVKILNIVPDIKGESKREMQDT